MKSNYLIVSTKTLIIASSVAFAVNTQAATTGTITLSGAVAAATAIVVTPAAGYNALDLSTTQSNLNVATVREINNTTLGYTVKVASTNAGLLKNGTLGSVTYTAQYNSSGFTLSATPQTVTTSAPANSIVNVTKPLTVSYTGTAAENLMQGSYSDTLTFTITSP
ncbi:fimbrial protein [Bdellovibrionota bacterium FG-2]